MLAMYGETSVASLEIVFIGKCQKAHATMEPFSTGALPNSVSLLVPRLSETYIYVAPGGPLLGLVGKVAPRLVQPLPPLCLVSSKACKLSASMRSDHNMVTIAEHLQIAIKAGAMQLLTTLSNHLAQVN